MDSCQPCSVDFNLDGNSDQDDLACFVAMIAGDTQSACYLGLLDYLEEAGFPDPGEVIGAILDFNNDGNADQDDTSAVINAIGGGGCP